MTAPLPRARGAGGGGRLGVGLGPRESGQASPVTGEALGALDLCGASLPAVEGQVTGSSLSTHRLTMEGSDPTATSQRR